MDTTAAFAMALKSIRKAKKMSQEDLQDVCSRVYISQLERGLKNPTLAMIEGLAEQMQVQPLTLMLKAYSLKHPHLSPEQLMQISIEELKQIE
ncbi:helix-turn-helix domain-containing protein [Chitinibacter bivalviorum]|nr:helix-turn-helix transcriptional regulator [Chitinibacter bivalviorum]